MNPSPRSPSRLLQGLFFLLFFQAAARTTLAEAPKVVIERVVDGRGNLVCDVVRATSQDDNVRRTAWLVRGLFKSDLILRCEVRKDPSGVESTSCEIRLDDHPKLRFETGSPGTRMTASSPASAFRYFDVDLARNTVRCNLSRLVEETDHDLLEAVGEYGLLKQSLGETYGREEYPISALLNIEKRAAHPSPPTRRRVPLPDDSPEAAELRTAALVALDGK